MAGLPPELTSAALATLGVGGTWFASWLARKGKREDTKIAQTNQTFVQLQSVADERLKDNDRLGAALVATRADLERVRELWETRWDRQMARCRKVTDSLVQAISNLRTATGPEAELVADAALRGLERHNEDDHPTKEDP